MPSSSLKATFSTLSPPIHSRSSSRESAALASEGEAEQDQLAFTIESPSRPQLQLFENIFNTGKSLALYCRDDPLWSTLAEKVRPVAVHVLGKRLAALGSSSAIATFPVVVVRTLHIVEGFWNHTVLLLNECPEAFLRTPGTATTTDTQAVDRRELTRFQWAQEQEAALAAKRKRTHVSPPRGGSTKKRRSKKTRSQPGASEVAAGEVPWVVRLVFPPARLAPPPSFPSPPRSSSPDSVFAPRVAPVSRQTSSVRDPESLVQLAEVAGRQTSFASGSAARLAVPTPLAIKGPQEVPNIIDTWGPSLRPLSPFFGMACPPRSRMLLSVVSTQHAGFIQPFDDSLEPPLHCRMFALETALPHHGLGNWEDLVPAVPSHSGLGGFDVGLDPFRYRYAFPRVCVASGSRGGPRGFDSPPPPGDVPLFLPDLTSPASPLPPDPSPPPPPLFGTVAALAIDLTGEDDDEDIYESPSSQDRHLEREVTDADGMEVDEDIPIKSELSVA
ncbi:MAG: hypothetical protein NXY57DRAFT_966148 [Lentinula lateritia]|nr:MAG: hypothetical protein NXY57DRAFT_966148 [Lentinula lateritia]